MTGIESISSHDELYRKVTEYWTPERMATAEPIDLRPADVTPRPEPRLPGEFKTGRVDNPDKNEIARKVGRLFVTFDGKPGIASASAINKDGILTAAHCLYDPEKKIWAKDVMFVPSYQDKKEPFGHWAVEVNTGSVPPEWLEEKPDRAWDYAFCRTGDGGFGKKKLGEVTGHFRLVVNRGESPVWAAFGYPSRPIKDFDFNGEWMWVCSGKFAARRNVAVIAKYGNLTKGSSGGPWVIVGGSNNDVNGVQAQEGSYPDENNSPYFNTATEKFYEKIFPATVPSAMA